MVMTSAHLAIAESMRLMPPELTGPAGPESHTLAGLEHLNVVLAAICSGLIPPVVLFTAGFPVFRLLDRLGSTAVATVPMPSGSAVACKTTHGRA